MAYFGDATAHAGVLGVALSLALAMPIFPGVVVAALAMGLTVSALAGRGVAEDTLLGVLAHGALAFGIVAMSLVPGVRVDLAALLLGDILAVTSRDLAVIWAVALAVLALLRWRWSALLTTTLDAEVAVAAGLNPRRESLALTLALALTVAIAIQIVGVLLVAALMIIPAAAARPLSSTPERMVMLSGAFGAISALSGFGVSVWTDTPTGPTIVCAALSVFIIGALSGLLRR